MDNIERLLGELALNNFEAESMHWVDVVHILNPSDFYVRPVKYNRLVATYRKMSPTEKITNVKVQDIVVYNRDYQQANVQYFIRGRVSRVHNVNDEVKCDIFAIDYGFNDKSVPIMYLWQCPSDLLSTPALAYRSQLANCFPAGSTIWTDCAIKTFSNNIGHGRVKMTIVGRTSRKLILKLMNTNLHDVATVLAVIGVSNVGSSDDCIPWKPLIIRKRFNFSFKRVNLSEKLHVKVLAAQSLNEFYVKEVNDYKQFLAAAENITFFARREYSLIPNHMIEGTIICVKDKEENMYHRAVINKVTKLNSTAILKLVDWGKDEEFPVDRMKYMSKEALKTTLTTIFCSVSKDKECEQEDILTPGNEFYITIKRLGHEFECAHTVEITPIEIEEDICEGAMALPVGNAMAPCGMFDSTESEKNKFELIEDFFPETSTCKRGVVEKRHSIYKGGSDFLNTPEISPCNSDEEDIWQEPITWNKLIAKRRVPYKGIIYKFVIPKVVDRRRKIKQPEIKQQETIAPVQEPTQNDEENEFEFSNFTDTTAAAEHSGNSKLSEITQNIAQETIPISSKHQQEGTIERTESSNETELKDVQLKYVTTDQETNRAEKVDGSEEKVIEK